MKREYTTADIRKMKEMAGKYSIKEIAECLNRTPAAISTFASRHGIYFSEAPYHRHTNSAVREVIRLKESGMSYRKIVAVTGVPISTCASWYRRWHEANLVSP